MGVCRLAHPHFFVHNGKIFIKNFSNNNINLFIMSINCRLTKNISLQSTSGSYGCNSTDLSEGVGGLISPVYVYNIDEVDGLKYENDNRADDTLIVDTIITNAAFYSIDFSNATYNEEFEDGKWTHTLTLTVNNITNAFEDALADAVNGKYLVAFRPNGATDFRMFGWKSGASLDYSMDVNGDSQGYTITLSDVSEYPLMTVYYDNFNVKDKIYTPIFKPLYDVAYCELEDDKNNGYAIAMYVVKVNSAGQALDSDNKLCQWSGKKQDAYKYYLSADGGYNILGTYDGNAVFDGQPVRVFDPTICPSDVQGSITINGASSYTVNLNSSKTFSSVTIASDDSWVMVSTPNYVSITPQNGADGTTIVTVTHHNVGGSEIIVFQNRKTRERVLLTVNVNLIKIGSQYTFQNGTTNFVLTPTVEGVTSGYSYTISPSMTIVKDNVTNYLNCSPSVSENEQNFNLVLTHSNDASEVKNVHITILGNNTDASWQLLASFCEII